MSRPLTGLSAWLVQRLSAVYLALFTIAALAVLTLAPPADYTDWRSLFTHPAGLIAWALFFFSLLVHGWVGLRDVVLDYAPGTGWRLFLLALVGGWTLAMAVWAARILIGVVA